MVAAWMGGLVAVALWPSVASAHAVLLRATPSSTVSLEQAPAQVQLLFSEPLDPVFSKVRVLNSNGRQVDRADSHVDPDNDRLLVASLQPNLPNGIYTVTWRSLSAIDVHPDDGEYPLFVGVPVTSAVTATVTSAFTATPATTLGRWWFYVAASLFGGVLAAWKFVLSGLLVGEHAGMRPVMRRVTCRLVVLGGGLLIVGTLFTAVAQASAAANVPLLDAIGRPVADLLLRGRFASIWWPRMGLEVASLLLIVFGGIDGLASECGLATLPAVLLTSALTSHGAALSRSAGTGIAVDWLHIVGATAWVGGLLIVLSFALVLRGSEDPSALLRPMVARFGRFALLSALVVLSSGVLQGTLEVGSWTALQTTLYGQLVLLKTLLLIAMLLLAGFNEWRARTTSRVAIAQVRGFGRGLSVELAFGMVVFAVAAMLSGTPPPPGGY